MNAIWQEGQDTELKTLLIKADMRLQRIESKDPKTGEIKIHSSLNKIGSKYGGECVGKDAKGRLVMVRLDVYLKDATQAKTATKSNFSIG